MNWGIEIQKEGQGVWGMTLEELEKEAREALKNTGNVILRIPKGGLPSSFPWGELLGEEEANGRIYRIYCFDADKILDWIRRSSHGRKSLRNKI